MLFFRVLSIVFLQLVRFYLLGGPISRQPAALHTKGSLGDPGGHTNTPGVNRHSGAASAVIALVIIVVITPTAPSVARAMIATTVVVVVVLFIS